MRNVQKFASVLAVPVLGLSVLAGCGHTVHEDTTTKTRSDGTQVTTKDKTVQHDDGTVTRTQTKEVNH
jgi:hypothetical protein